MTFKKYVPEIKQHINEQEAGKQRVMYNHSSVGVMQFSARSISLPLFIDQGVVFREQV